jgi:hypothetical protein
MNPFKHVTVKFQGMRKAQVFTVTPIDPAPFGHEVYVIQADNRIARVMKGQTMLSKNTGSANPGFNYLHPSLGAKLVETPDGLLEELRELTGQINFRPDGSVQITGFKKEK